MPLAMWRPIYVRVNGATLSEHNRSPVEVDVERIESRTRVASGRLRKQFVADKRTFSISWTDLPETAANTVDGAWGAQEIIDFFNTTTGPFTLGLVQSNNVVQDYTVVFTDFSANPTKRWERYYYDVEFTVEEV